jgi:tripartite-type tricarboxylate transporter receptor subunit TctC
MEIPMPGLHIWGWFALFAPKGTPKDIVSKLNAEVRSLLADSATRERFAELGTRNSSTRPTDHRLTRCVSKSRNCEVVADHQGGECQR